MPQKTYAIVHDGTNLLVGKGGHSGKAPAPRRGNHLPGGTIDDGKMPTDEIVREIKEETGFALVQQRVAFTVEKLKNITFFVIQIPSVSDLVHEFKRPEVTSPHDEPFEAVSSVSIISASQPGFFNANDCTDWFADALSYAVGAGLLA